MKKSIAVALLLFSAVVVWPLACIAYGNAASAPRPNNFKLAATGAAIDATRVTAIVEGASDIYVFLDCGGRVYLPKDEVSFTDTCELLGARSW